MSSTTTEFTLLNYRRASLRKLIEACESNQPARAKLAEDAIRRIDAGAYGYCVRCGIRIPEAALERRPERPGCTSCDPD